jgi:hypothetical protein
MTYFAANGTPLGQKRPPQAQANGVGRYFGRDDPQAAANGFGRLGRLGQMPPQAQTDGLGRFGMIGMLPPQAQAGIGDDMTPSGIPEGEPHAYRDGIFGNRLRTTEEGLLPYKDGVFGPALPTGVGLGQNSNGPVLNLSNPDVINEIKIALNLLVGSYSPTPGNAYDQATQAAYVTYTEEETPGYPNKQELYLSAGGVQYPSARGIYVLMQGARMAWQGSVGYDTSFDRVVEFYPLLWGFSTAYEAAEFSGTVTPPAANGNGNGDKGPMQASTVALVGVGAVGLGLAFMLMRPKKRRSTPNRRRRRRRR